MDAIADILTLYAYHPGTMGFLTAVVVFIVAVIIWLWRGA